METDGITAFDDMNPRECRLLGKPRAWEAGLHGSSKPVGDVALCQHQRRQSQWHASGQRVAGREMGIELEHCSTSELLLYSSRLFVSFWEGPQLSLCTLGALRFLGHWSLGRSTLILVKKQVPWSLGDLGCLTLGSGSSSSSQQLKIFSCYGLELEFLPKAPVLQAWSPGWHKWEYLKCRA